MMRKQAEYDNADDDGYETRKYFASYFMNLHQSSFVGLKYIIYAVNLIPNIKTFHHIKNIPSFEWNVNPSETSLLKMTREE